VSNAEFSANQVRWITMPVPSNANYDWTLMAVKTNSPSTGVMCLNHEGDDSAMIRNFLTQAQSITLTALWIGIKS